MKQYVKTNKILLILLAGCVLVSLAVVARRWQLESDNKTYDIVLDYSELELLAEQSEHDISWWLGQFRDMGITQVGLTEESLTTLMTNSPYSVTALPIDKITQDEDWREDYPDSFIRKVDQRGFDRFDVLVKAAGDDAIDFVVGGIKGRLSPDCYIIETVETAGATVAYLLLDGEVNDALYQSVGYATTLQKGMDQHSEIESSKLMYLALGLMPEKVELIQAQGMEIIPRTLAYEGRNDARFAQDVIRGYESYQLKPEYIIAGGEAAIGWDDGGEILLDYIRDKDITIGLIETAVQRENLEQDGVEEMTRARDYNTVRVFSVWDYIQYRYAYYNYEGAEEIENTLYRAVTERNIRVIYFKPIKEHDNRFAYITDPEVYRDMFDSLDQRLAEHGISRGRASVMGNVQVPRLAMLALGLGAGLCGALLPAAVLPMKKKWTLALGGLAAVCVAAAWVVMPNTFRQVASFASAVVFACLAAAFFLMAAKQAGRTLPRNAGLGRILPRAAAILALSVLIALAGAMMTAAPLSSTDYLLELGIFRGVKAAQLLPLAFFCVLFMAYYGLFEADRRADTLRLEDIVGALNWRIPVWSLILLAVLAMAGYYYLARTGHETAVSVSNLEIIMRNVLEEHLLARPRTKEFLVAFPGMMLAVYCAVRRLPLGTVLFGLAGTIGLTSVCNTFMHIRTPLYLGLARTAGSLVLGLVLGVVYVVCFELLYRLLLLARKKYIEAERG